MFCWSVIGFFFTQNTVQREILCKILVQGVRSCHMAGLHEHLWRAAEAEWWCFVPEFGGAMWLPMVPLDVWGQGFIRDTRKWEFRVSVLKLPIFRAGFCRGHVGVCRAQVSLAVKVEVHSQVQAWLFLGLFPPLWASSALPQAKYPPRADHTKLETTSS